MDCADLLATAGMQHEMVCSLPAVAQDWDVYQHTIEAIDIMQLTAPLVEGLRRYTYMYILYSGKLSREKTSVNFEVLWLFAEVFSVKFGTVGLKVAY